MKYNLSNQNEIYIFQEHCKKLLEDKSLCELAKVGKKRTNLQNASLHKWFDLISDALNDLGLTYTVKVVNEIEHPFTAIAVKEHIIKPIILSMYNYTSTTQLKTNEIDDLIDVVSKWLGDKGVFIPFPSIQSLIDYFYGKE